MRQLPIVEKGKAGYEIQMQAMPQPNGGTLYVRKKVFVVTPDYIRGRTQMRSTIRPSSSKKMRGERKTAAVRRAFARF